jgi:anaerobic selenocysteine-containing dehydrogenase
MFSYERLSEGGSARHPGPRSEVSVLADLGRRVLGDGGPLNWPELQSHQRIRALMAELIPGLEPLAEIDRTRREFHIAGRRLSTPRFPTASGRAQFHPVRLPEAPQTSGRMVRLMTVRSEGQFNTVVYEEADLYRGQERRDVILISQQDMQRFALTAGQLVTVRSEVGEMRRQQVRPYQIRPGNVVMYYPEANAIVPRAVDPRSRTPAFKSVLVELIPETARP